MLTDTALRNLKPKSLIYKASDCDGMYVTVSPAGTVTFRYDSRLSGRRETLTIGRYGPAGISLAMAQEKLLDVKRAVARGESPTQNVFTIVDAQSVKNTETAALKGYDAGKKVSGIKRHIAVDTQGFPHAVAVTTAEVTDHKGALQAGLGASVKCACDGGYTGEPFAQGVRETLGQEVTLQIARRSELHEFSVIPKRWVVERSFSWLEKNR